MGNKKRYYTGRIGYKPRRQFTVRENRIGTKMKVFISFLLFVCLVICSTYVAKTAYAQSREQCRRYNAVKLGQEVQKCSNGLACSLLVRCGDNEADNDETFTCDIMPELSAEEISSQINYLWNKKAQEVNHELCTYKGSSLICIDQAGVSFFEDSGGNYELQPKIGVRK